MALRGEYDFIDGLVMFNSCDHIRRVYDHWIRQIETPFVEILSLPRKAEAEQVEWFRGELADLRSEHREHFGVEITDDALREAIALHNKSRRLLREIYELRKSDAPADHRRRDARRDRCQHGHAPGASTTSCLEELLDELESADGHHGYRARLMVLGGELDNPDYIQIIEDQGGAGGDRFAVLRLADPVEGRRRETPTTR